MALSPVWRHSLRLWLATSLSAGIMLWSRQDGTLFLALIMAITFINENDRAPLRTIAVLMGAAVVGVLTGLVVQAITTAWPVLALALLASGALLRWLRLSPGQSMGYLATWAMVTSGGGSFRWSIAASSLYAIVVGIVCAQLSTWVFWPRRPLQQLPGLERGLAGQLIAQIARVGQWIQTGGPPPPRLRSQDLLPLIQQMLEMPQVRGRREEQLVSRWGQVGAIWNQILRQWLLLEPLLLELPAPLTAASRSSLLMGQLQALEQGLQEGGATAAVLLPEFASSAAALWLEEADRLQISRPLLLALALQCAELQKLLHSRALMRRGIGRLGST
jgi:hypothetical protein